MVPDKASSHGAQRQSRPRIETQIHRRKKAKALSALELEWDQIEQESPSHLRMPSDCMSSSPSSKAKGPHHKDVAQGNDKIHE
jgi:hypothetical protein